jgi:hypothetical protein
MNPFTINPRLREKLLDAAFGGNGLTLELRHVGVSALRLAGGILDEFQKLAEVFLLG